MYTNYLYHHGIKGQKWGVRRYQNEDGSVTAAGAKRYYQTESVIKDYVKEQNKINKETKAMNKELSDLYWKFSSGPMSQKKWDRMNELEKKLKPYDEKQKKLKEDAIKKLKANKEIQEIVDFEKNRDKELKNFLKGPTKETEEGFKKYKEKHIKNTSIHERLNDIDLKWNYDRYERKLSDAEMDKEWKKWDEIQSRPNQSIDSILDKFGKPDSSDRELAKKLINDVLK